MTIEATLSRIADALEILAGSKAPANFKVETQTKKSAPAPEKAAATPTTAAEPNAATKSEEPSTPTFLANFKPLFLKLVTRDRAAAVALAAEYNVKTFTEEVFNKNATKLMEQVSKLVAE